MDSRERFESHIIDNYGADNDWLALSNDGYMKDEIDGMWTAWQACEASREFDASDIVGQLRELHNSGDTEAAHGMADKLLCNMLERLGYNEVVDAYKIIDKWYA